MKKLLGFLFVLLVIYVIHVDLTIGSLPSASYSQKAEAKATVATKEASISKIPSFEAKVGPGDTVITIVEQHSNQAIPVSITDLIADFQKLNPGQAPEKIRIGATYRFPDYSKK